MTTITAISGTRTSLTATALNSLGSVTYGVSSALDVSASDPLDVIIEVELTPGTVSSYKQARVFLKVSTDNSNFSTGPESGTTVTDEGVLYPLGVVPLTTNSTLQRRMFSVASALGWVPPYMKVVVFNESGAALAGSGNALYSTVITGSAA